MIGRNKAFCAMARVVISALGFPSFRHIAAVAAVNHQTAADILYRRKGHSHTHKASILRLYQVVYTEWQLKKFGFKDNEFRMYRDWLNDWRSRLLNETLLTRRPGRRLPDEQMKYKRDIRWRAKREAKRKAEMESALRKFE